MLLIVATCTGKIKLVYYVPVMGDSPVMRLGGMDGMRNGPTTSGGIILMKFKLCSLANSHAAFSASVFDTKYICILKSAPIRFFGE